MLVQPNPLSWSSRILQHSQRQVVEETHSIYRVQGLFWQYRLYLMSHLIDQLLFNDPSYGIRLFPNRKSPRVFLPLFFWCYEVLISVTIFNESFTELDDSLRGIAGILLHSNSIARQHREPSRIQLWTDCRWHCCLCHLWWSRESPPLHLSCIFLFIVLLF